MTDDLARLATAHVQAHECLVAKTRELQALAESGRETPAQMMAEWEALWDEDREATDVFRKAFTAG